MKLGSHVHSPNSLAFGLQCQINACADDGLASLSSTASAFLAAARAIQLAEVAEVYIKAEQAAARDDGVMAVVSAHCSRTLQRGLAAPSYGDSSWRTNIANASSIVGWMFTYNRSLEDTLKLRQLIASHRAMVSRAKKLCAILKAWPLVPPVEEEASGYFAAAMELCYFVLDGCWLLTPTPFPRPADVMESEAAMLDATQVGCRMALAAMRHVGLQGASKQLLGPFVGRLKEMLNALNSYLDDAPRAQDPLAGKNVPAGISVLSLVAAVPTFVPLITSLVPEGLSLNFLGTLVARLRILGCDQLRHGIDDPAVGPILCKATHSMLHAQSMWPLCEGAVRLLSTLQDYCHKMPAWLKACPPTSPKQRR